MVASNERGGGAGGDTSRVTTQNTGSSASTETRDSNCASCGREPLMSGGTGFVYALGRVQYRLPTLGVEKELIQVTKQVESAGLTSQQVEAKVFTDPQFRYLARQLCWILTVEGFETYILVLRDAADLDTLLRAIRPAQTPWDVDLVIGTRGPLAPPAMCNGLTIPIVAVDQIYSFDRDALIKSIPRAADIGEEQEKQFWATANEVFDRIMQLADNAGAADEHRAVNYLAVRYPGIYGAAADAAARESSLTSVDVRPSRLTGVRKIVDVVFSFTSRKTDVVEKLFVRVDVTEEFPFLVTKLSPFFDR